MNLTTRFGVIDDWLEDCFRNHKSCHDIKMTGYPRRLLDVSGISQYDLDQEAEISMS